LKFEKPKSERIRGLKKMSGHRGDEKFIEENHREGVALRFGLVRRLFSQMSPFQKVEIVETTHHGRMLLNDGAVMVSERDEAIYHEMMAHVPLFVHPDPRRVLIIGGGDGGTAREVLRHPSVEKCVMVEIDGAVVEGCRKFIPQTAKALDDARLRLEIGDGVAFVKDSAEKFDVVLVDSTDPVGPAQPLFGGEFYENVRRRLNADGIVVAQGETPFYESDAQAALMKILGEKFPVVMPYNFTNMTYPGGLWSFIFASQGLHPVRNFVPERAAGLKLEYFYYNAAIHRAAFSLPSFQNRRLAGLIKSP
jgi:spermidine synthase